MNERIVELVNREIDGLLATHEQHELQRAVAADPEVRQFYDSHIYAAGLLKKLPVAPAPPSLKGNIMTAVRTSVAKHPSQTKGRKPRFSFATFFQPSSAFPLAVGMAAGVFFTVIFWGNEPVPYNGGIGLTGTLVDWSAAGEGADQSPIEFSAGNARINLRWVGSDNRAIVFISIAGGSDVTVGIQAESGDLPALSVTQQSAGPGEIRVGGGMVAINHSGTNSYAAVFDRGNRPSLPLTVNIAADGESVSRSLTIEWR